MSARPTADIVSDLRLNAIRPFLQQNVAVEQYVKDAADRLTELDLLVRDLTSDEECYFDHHGYCQAHMWFHTDPACPHARSKENP